MTTFLQRFYFWLMVLACISMVAAFVSIMLGVAARELHWDIPGLDAYAGYSIAAALFLALPETLQHGDHIRVSLLLGKLKGKLRTSVEAFCLVVASAMGVYLAWFSSRLVWVSYTTHDVSPSADATPLWIPQISMALGCMGFALCFMHALYAQVTGRDFYATPQEGELAKTE